MSPKFKDESCETPTKSKCLVFKNNFGNLFFVPDMTQVSNEREKILRIINEKVETFDMQSIADPSLRLTSRNSIYELQSMSERLAYLNERFFSHPIVPNEPTSNVVELMATEKNVLSGYVLSLEQEVQNHRQSYDLINQSIGPVSQPTSNDPKVAGLMIERNLRIKVICNAKKFYNNLSARKGRRLRVRSEDLNFLGSEEVGGPKSYYVDRKIDEALANYETLIRLNKYALSVIDTALQELDKPFHDRLIAIDENTHHLFCKRGMFARKLFETEKILNLTNDRINYIDKKLKELRQNSKIGTFVRIGLGMDEDGLLASALQIDDAEKQTI